MRSTKRGEQAITERETVTRCHVCGATNPATNRFCGTCGSPLDASKPKLAEERRWATVLFVDISGFTAMSERMDPEDVRELAKRAVERFGEQVARFGGTVLREMGDEILAVFGAPVAHEDDAERAVRAALAIRDLQLEGPDRSRLRLHVGVNTGEIITSLVSIRDHQDYTVHGDAVNTGARLRAAATPGTVLVGEETYRATEHAVRYRAVAPVEAKGKDRPLGAWEAIDVAPVPAARPAGTGPLIGRDEELTLLTGIWGKVSRESRPHLVTVLGDPGIGKSRLVAEFERQALAGSIVLHGRCPPYGEVVGYWALTLALREAAGIRPEDDAASAQDKLRGLVARVIEADGSDEDPDELTRYLALLGGFEGQQTRISADQPTLYGALRRFLEAFARAQPVVIILDDIHWADDSLLDLVEFVASRVRDVPLMILTQTRPELLARRPTWGRGVRAFTSISLEPLDNDAASKLITALSAQHGLAPDVTLQVGRGAGGNPLFAEELVAMLAERGGGSQIPSAIKVLISARIDALEPDERTVLQRAAVFGKVFWEGGLRRLDAPEPLDEYLDALEYKDLLRAQQRSRFPGDREYAFKHDLIRDVAYEMLLRADRRALHGQIAEWIEAAAGDRPDEYLDLLAHHAVQAGQRERAVQYLAQAAERAHRAASYRKEAELLGGALEIAGDELDPEEALQLRYRRGRALGRAALWPQAGTELETVLEALPTDEPERRAEVLLDLAAVRIWGSGQLDAADIAEQALELAEQLGRQDLAAGALMHLGLAEAGQGHPITGLQQFEDGINRARRAGVPLRGSTLQGASMQSIVLYWAGRNDEAIKAGRHILREALDQNESVARVLAAPQLGLALAAKGRYDEAQQVFEDARRFGRECEIWGPLARATSMSAGLHLELFDLPGHGALVEEARQLGRDRFPPTLAFTGVDLLLNAARSADPGRVEGTIDEVAEAVERATGWHRWLSAIRLNEALGELALARGDAEGALQWTDLAIELSRKVSREKYEALALTTRAAALHKLGRTKEGLADLRLAVDRARAMDDPALLVHSAVPLLTLDGDAVLAHESRQAVDRILRGLTDAEMRRRFEDAEPVRIVLAGTPA